MSASIVAALVEATLTCPVGEYAVGYEKVRFLSRITRANLPGLLPPGFDPIGGTERGVPAISIDTDFERRLCERIHGLLYQASLVALVRAEHPGVRWLVGVGYNDEYQPIIGVVAGRVVAAIQCVAPCADAGAP